MCKFRHDVQIVARTDKSINVFLYVVHVLHAVDFNARKRFALFGSKFQNYGIALHCPIAAVFLGYASARCGNIELVADETVLDRKSVV